VLYKALQGCVVRIIWIRKLASSMGLQVSLTGFHLVVPDTKVRDQARPSKRLNAFPHPRRTKAGRHLYWFTYALICLLISRLQARVVIRSTHGFYFGTNARTWRGSNPPVEAKYISTIPT
jgi:hypothetical protein